MAAGDRSQRTLDGYQGDIERYLSAWLGTSLRDLSDDAKGVAARHREITQDHGPYSANGAMRALRAVYRHARKTRLERGLPAEQPAFVLSRHGSPAEAAAASAALERRGLKGLRVLALKAPQARHNLVIAQADGLLAARLKASKDPALAAGFKACSAAPAASAASSAAG